MQKKKIVHIVDTLCVGGREKIVIDICNNTIIYMIIEIYIIGAVSHRTTHDTRVQPRRSRSVRVGRW